MSTLFWAYASFGLVLWVLCFAAAPALAAFYHEPSLVAVTGVLGSSCLFTTAGAQHHAILQRELRYVAIAVIESASLTVSIVVGVAMGLGGYGYWALVGATIVLPACNTMGFWLATRWVPGPPHRDAAIGPALRFGGLIIFNIAIVYLAYNFDKILIGWFWGAETLGVYGRAYQLATIPSESINAAVGGVVFAALSRLQGDAVRFKAFFLNGYALVTSLSFPIAILCALYAPELVHLVLGPQWAEASGLLRLLTPAILVFGIINPLGWLMFSAGMVGRSTCISLVLAPLVIAAYAIGIAFGPSGVALALSTAMTLWLVPHVMWCLRRTTITLTDLIQAASRPFAAAAGAGILVFGVQMSGPGPASPLWRLIIGTAIMVAAYVTLLIIMFGPKLVRSKLLSAARRPSQAPVQVRACSWTEL